MPTSVARVGANLANGAFLPEIWSKKLQAKFYQKTVLSQIANHNWEGEIKQQGSRVKIRVRPTIAISDYSVNSTLTYQDLQDNFIDLLIDKAKSYSFKVDDVDKAQSDINIVNEATMDAAEQMKIAIDAQVLGSVYGSATTSMTAQQVTKLNVLDWIVSAAVRLDELSVPESGRYLVLPPWICGMILSSDLNQVQVSGDNKSMLRTGMVGRVANFDIYQSNSIGVTAGAPDTYHCIAGQREAVTFASQFVKTETIRLQDTFGDAIRGLNVYGFKVAQPDALIHLPATK